MSKKAIPQEPAIREYLSSKVGGIKNTPLMRACAVPLNDQRFFTYPASVDKHQVFAGGLAQHTKEVMEIALSMADAAPLDGKVDKDIIIASVLWHDYGKIWDYVKVDDQEPQPTSPYPEFAYRRHRFTIRHLSRSHAEFMIAARAYGVDDELTEEVAHCILAHHGRQEWGSPVEPLTLEAAIIHFADMIDARFVEPKHIFRQQEEQK